MSADCYISIDVEADGPIPGPFSMLAIGLCVAGRFEGSIFQAQDPDAETHYVELKPISDQFDPEALEVAGVDRDLLVQNGTRPEEAMDGVGGWIEAVAGNATPVICAFPASFDWLFFYWYQRRFGRDVVGFSSCLDMKTIFATKAKRTLSDAGRDDLPAELQSQRPHTHNALDDAKEQAEIFAKLFTWSGA